MKLSFMWKLSLSVVFPLVGGFCLWRIRLKFCFGFLGLCWLDRLWRFQLPKLASMDTQSVTLLELTYSLGKSLRILSHLPITVMYVWECLLDLDFVFFMRPLKLIKVWYVCFCGYNRFLMLIALTTSSSTSQRMGL